jgi:hypothetical protein
VHWMPDRGIPCRDPGREVFKETVEAVRVLTEN